MDGMNERIDATYSFINFLPLFLTDSLQRVPFFCFASFSFHAFVSFALETLRFTLLLLLRCA